MSFHDQLRAYLGRTNTSVQDFAGKANVTTAAVYLWLQGKRVPSAAVCIRIEWATGGAITREQIRPEVFAQRPAA